MSKYSKFGEVAIKATEIYRIGGGKTSPRRAWEKAANEVFPNSESSQDKSCPRDAYLGLYQEGLIRGVPAGDYTQSIKNKDYAVSAVNILKQQPHLTQDIPTLWREALKMQNESVGKTHNQQMDVVAALWSKDYITR